MNNQYIKNHINNIMVLLDKVESNLKSAKNWGIYDILAGGGLTSLIKHSKINKSEEDLYRLKRELELLNQELTRVNLDISDSLNIGPVNKFFDIFMDNTFSDLLTQSKINDGLSQLRSLRRVLNNIYNNLQ